MITQTQLANRRNYIGASEIAALFTTEDGKSLDPYQTMFDVWASKVYELERPLPVTDAQDRGNRYEPALIQYAEQKLGCMVITDPDLMEYWHPRHHFLVAHLDGITATGIAANDAAVECKTTTVADEYGEEMTDQVPYRVLIQTHFQMACSGFRKVYVSALLGRRGAFEGLYVIEWDERIGTRVVERAVEFWEKYVIPRVQPPDSQPGDIEFLKRIKREPQSFADVPEDVILQWEQARQARLAAEKEEEKNLAELLAHLKDTEGAKLPDGRTLTYFTQHSSSLDTTILKEKYPDAYKAANKQTAFRVPRIRKA